MPVSPSFISWRNAMGRYEKWYRVDDENLYEVIENDGYDFLRRGAERTVILLCTVEEAVKAFPKELAQATGVTNAIRNQTPPL